MTTWHDRTSARDEWEDAPSNDARLDSLLEVARDKVTDYARPADLVGDVAPDFTIPQRLREAQLRVAINLWNDEQDDTQAVDTDFPVTRRYLEWKKIVRPGKAVPRVR